MKKYFLLLSFLVVILFSSCKNSQPVINTNQSYYGLKTVLDYGAVSGDNKDDSEAFQKAIDQENLVIIPPGIYNVQNLNIRNGTEIIALSKKSNIRGVNKESVIFRSSSSMSNISIKGGSWTKFGILLEHTGHSALNTSLFADMKINTFDIAFKISSSISNKFVDIDFGGGAALNNFKNGIIFTGTGKGQTNINKIVDCKFIRFTGNAIKFGNAKNPKNRNSIVRCWFEEGGSSAVWISNYTFGLNIEQCYFEEAGTQGVPDITVGLDNNSVNRRIVVQHCSFQTSKNRAQAARIKAKGKTELTIRENMATLVNNSVFIRFENSNVPFRNIVENNYLNAVGGGKYIDRLFTKSKNQNIEWSPCPGSGFVTDDEIKE